MFLTLIYNLSVNQNYIKDTNSERLKMPPERNSEISNMDHLYKGKKPVFQTYYHIWSTQYLAIDRLGK